MTHRFNFRRNLAAGLAPVAAEPALSIQKLGRRSPDASSGASSTTQWPTSASRWTSACGQAAINRSRQSGRKHQSRMPQIKQAGRSASVGRSRSISCAGSHVAESVRDWFRSENSATWVGISCTNPYTARRFAQESYGAKYPAATAGSNFAAPGERHSQRRQAEQVAALHRQAAHHRHAAGANPPRNIPRRKRARVEQHDPLQPLGHPQHRPQADRSAPILGDERHAFEAQTFDKRTQIRNVIIQPQQPCWLLAQSATDMVDRHAAILRPQPDDQPPPVERPCRIAVDEQSSVARRTGTVRLGTAAAPHPRSASARPARLPNATRTDTSGRQRASDLSKLSHARRNGYWMLDARCGILNG